MKLYTIVLSLTLYFNLTQCQPYSCYQLEANPYSFYASKTVYSYSSPEQNYSQPGCKTLQIWLLSRHGTRHPSADIIDDVYELYKYKNKLTDKSTLCHKDIEAIRAWNINLSANDGDTLNSQGAVDLSSFGLRLRNVFGDIFNEQYNPTAYKVISSPKSRSVNSASYFLKSALNTSKVDIPIMKNDDIRLNISMFKDIQDPTYAFQTYSGHKSEIELEEDKKFGNSKHMKQLLFRVSKTLGLNHILTMDTVRAMYESCRYEKAWHIDSHPAWCAVFTEEDLKILEYKEDLYHYYSNGYGNPHNTKLGCPLIKDLITSFRNKAQTKQGPKGVFYFGHASNVLSAIVTLGFAKDSKPLLSSNFEEMHDRKWKSSILSPFAANLMAVLYECPSGKKVTFLLNETPMVIEKYGCTLCSWELIKSMFDPIISGPSCTFVQTSSASIVSKTLILFFLTFLLGLYNAFDF